MMRRLFKHLLGLGLVGLAPQVTGDVADYFSTQRLPTLWAYRA